MKIPDFPNRIAAGKSRITSADQFDASIPGADTFVAGHIRLAG
jgi:hypothetical protein